jgi:hypothetical protein
MAHSRCGVIRELDAVSQNVWTFDTESTLVTSIYLCKTVGCWLKGGNRSSLRLLQY